MAKEVDFEWSDAWILLSISGSQGESGSALVDIIAVADMLNHAIPTCTELETAITKLLKADIVSIQDNMITIQEDIRRELRELQKKPGGLFSLVDKVEKYLKRKRFEEKNSRMLSLTEQEVKEAYDAYKQKYWGDSK